MTATGQLSPAAQVPPLTDRPRRAARALTAGPVALWARWGSLALVVLGVAIRVRQWAEGRSLWLDEALIARSLVERGHVQLATEPLLHNQAAPQGWLQATRLAVDLFGEGERPLRLVALLAGCLSLLLVHRLAATLLPAVVAPVAVGLCALHPDLVYYSSEVKPYATDVLVVLALLLLAARDRPLLLGLAGAVAVWCSYPAVFVLAGASILLVLRRRRLQERVTAALQLSPWVGSLAAAYVLVLAPLRDREVYALYWAYTYPRGVLDLPSWAVRRAADLLDTPLRLSVPLLGAVLLAVGAIRLLRRDRFRAGLLLAAVPVAVVAGAIAAYPLADRLTLWTVPLAAVLLAAVLPGPQETSARRALPLALLAVLATAGPGAARTLPLLVQPQHVEELRPVLEQVAQRRQAGDLVLVDIAAKAAFDHYGPRLGVPRDGVVLFHTPAPGTDCGDDLVALRNAEFGNGRVWLVLSHDLVEGPVLGTRADLLSRIGRVTRLVAAVREPGAQALLLRPGRGGPNLPAVPPTPDRCLMVHRSAR